MKNHNATMESIKIVTGVMIVTALTLNSLVHLTFDLSLFLTQTGYLYPNSLTSPLLVVLGVSDI